MNSSAYIPFLTLPPVIVTTIFTILFISLIAPHNEEISFIGIKFKIPQKQIPQKFKKSYFSLLIIFFLLLCIVLFLPIRPFSCRTEIAEPVENGEKTLSNVRAYPNTKSKIILSLKDETKINVINIKQGWVRIKTEDKIEGFVAANRTKAALDCPGLFLESSNDFSVR